MSNSNYNSRPSQPACAIIIEVRGRVNLCKKYIKLLNSALNPLSILRKIYHCKAYNSLHLESVINDLDKSIEQYNVKLVILDSIMSLHRLGKEH